MNFNLKKGEILGFAGLIGAGRTEVARAIFGADVFDSGEIYVKGQRVHIKSPGDAVTRGIGYLSEDRKRYGLALGMDVKENIAMAAMKKFLIWLGWVDFKKTIIRGQEMVKALNIKTPNLEQKVKFLSGGNQQKVVIGKWLTADTDILIFDEPTRGIDVGAKSEIYKLLNDLAHQGKSIIMISSELPGNPAHEPPVIVMCEGRVTGILSAGEATQESIMKFATMRSEAVLATAQVVQYSLNYGKKQHEKRTQNLSKPFSVPTPCRRIMAFSALIVLSRWFFAGFAILPHFRQLCRHFAGNCGQRRAGVRRYFCHYHGGN